MAATNNTTAQTGALPSSLQKSFLLDNGNVFSIMGPAYKGKSFIPTGITSYNSGNLDFISSLGSFKEN